MFYYLYKITNLVNAKIYVGVHKTKNLDDGYMGSGKVIIRAIDKHGTDSFRKDILEYFDNSKSMYAREKEVVTEIFLLREDTYNLRRGGFGGFDYINKNKDESYYKTRSNNGKAHNATNSQFAPSNWVKHGKDNPFFGIKTKTNFSNNGEVQKKATINAQSKSAQQKRKETFITIGHAQGNKNSQFSTMWITNDVENKKIKKDMPLPDGWRLGRINGNTKLITSIVKWK